MEALIPWAKLLAVIEPFYPKGERGRPPIGLERMLRVYFLQQWYGLADEALEDALYDSQALQGFARIDLAAEGVPDATTLLKFRRLLETHDLCQGLFAAINTDLTARGLLLREGTLVDATLIAAPPSTKNKEKQRDPEMHQTRKGNQWYFGMKAHIGVDAESGLVHTAGVTTGKVNDAKVMANLIREDDTAIYGDKGYASDAKKQAAEKAGVRWRVKEKAKPGRELTKRQRARNSRFGKVRAKVEHVFRVLKCQFGYRKVRYRGIAKNGAQVFALFALANLYLVRGRLASA
jgi:IS5 family transposase